jgi:hypothetical protein
VTIDAQSGQTCHQGTAVNYTLVSCVVGQHIDAIDIGNGNFYGATIVSVNTDTQMMVANWDAGSGDFDVQFQQTKDDSGTVCALGRSSQAAATELRWKFTEGVGGNANGIRLAEISLYAEAETSAGDYGEVS